MSTKHRQIKETLDRLAEIIREKGKTKAGREEMARGILDQFSRRPVKEGVCDECRGRITRRYLYSEGIGGCQSPVYDEPRCEKCCKEYPGAKDTPMVGGPTEPYYIGNEIVSDI